MSYVLYGILEVELSGTGIESLCGLPENYVVFNIIIHGQIKAGSFQPEPQRLLISLTSRIKLNLL